LINPHVGAKCHINRQVCIIAPGRKENLQEYLAIWAAASALLLVKDDETTNKKESS